ncbi:hypothetical protein CBER1_07735 [Cercospora berteroae]|uniref:Uncharacterized protein n=1 Tax=Cercospora berteroae TaxID=357750 RepID=A0A2S6BSS1_9PEZI|nr:hypothetical protein CBER1_07735 [Cercospora berteroae]
MLARLRRPAHTGAVSALLRGTFNDRYDSHDRHDQRAAVYTTSLQSRVEHAPAVERLRLHDLSRPSSSSGSVGSHSLRRTARFEEPRPSRLRSTSVDAPVRTEPSPTRFREESPPPRAQTTPPKAAYHRRATSAQYSTSTTHPALRISKRTHSAILYALEEAIRKPNPFTPDEDEEYALMSDLGGGSAGRASNGGARTAGPVPVGGAAQIRTPRDVMRERNAREARRQEQQKEEEQRRVAEERRRSAERRAATVPGAAPRFSNTSSQYSPDVRAQAGFDDPAAERRQSRVAGEVAGTSMLGEPTGRVSQDPPSRDRSQSASRPEPLRPTPAATRRTQQPNQPRAAPATTAGATAGPSASLPGSSTAPGEGAQRSTQSSFPHAFERWETLSSHWEGLTSYWLHKLEQNTEEIKDKVPTASTLARQITDLSAAGANLFHAVVELQRLRASSERKFQRWFFETRADNERNRELQAGMERQLNIERKAREDTVLQQAEAAQAVENAKREVAEMRRELMISKDEARRAWEELGRRNQESLDTAQSLKEGRITVVSGVQVVPYFGQPSRTGSASQGGQRPVTRDGPQPGYSSAGFSAGAAGLATPGDDERQYYREEGPSPTNTDPFTESGRQQPLHHEPGKPSLAQGTYYPPSGSSTSQPASTSAARPGAAQTSTMSPERFYQQGGPSTSLHASQADASRPVVTNMPPPARADTRSQPRSEAESYVSTEYELDHTGSFRLDSQGNRIPYVARPQQGPSDVRSENSEDDYDTEQAVRRERELAAQYGGGMIPEAPSIPSTSAAAMAAGYVPTTGPSEPDYEGAGYEDYQQQVPYQMQGRHHHPTRLSDVLEEEEERSSRRTGD